MPAMPYLDRAWPRHTVPAIPRGAIPVHATPASLILAHPSLPRLRRRYWPGNAMPRLPHLAIPRLPHLALPALPCNSMLDLALPRLPCRALHEPDHA